MMDDKRIRSILQDALEEKIPSSQVSLWPAVKANLVAGKSQLLQQGETMTTAKPHRIPRLAFAILAIIALLAIVLATPQGRAWAQSVLQFFMPAESSTFPLESSQIMTSEPDPSAPTAEPPMPLISVAEAEARVGFGVAELPFVPDGLNYLGARLYGNAVSIEYEAQGRGGNLLIMQSQEGFVQSDWDRVPAEAIVPVKIGELEGEFAQGTFVVYPGETVATWNPEAPILRLRWMKDGVWFEMTKFGDVKAIEYLDQAGLVQLAGSLVIRP
jgi:hypothetical protein